MNSTKALQPLRLDKARKWGAVRHLLIGPIEWDWLIIWEDSPLDLQKMMAVSQLINDGWWFYYGNMGYVLNLIFWGSQSIWGIHLGWAKHGTSVTNGESHLGNDFAVFVGTQKRKAKNIGLVSKDGNSDMTEKRWSLMVGFHWKWELLVNGRFVWQLLGIWIE